MEEEEVVRSYWLGRHRLFVMSSGYARRGCHGRKKGVSGGGDFVSLGHTSRIVETLILKNFSTGFIIGTVMKKKKGGVSVVHVEHCSMLGSRLRNSGYKNVSYYFLSN